MDAEQLMGERVLKMKVCLVGEGGVGKTSLIRRFVWKEFDDRYLFTLGTNVSKKQVLIENKGQRIIANLMVWDIMGQKGFWQLFVESYFNGADGALAVFDLTRKETLHALTDWLDRLRKERGDLPIVLACNKADQKDRINVSQAEIEELARKYGAPYYYTSARDGNNVEEAFQLLAAKMAHIV